MKKIKWKESYLIILVGIFVLIYALNINVNPFNRMAPVYDESQDNLTITIASADNTATAGKPYNIALNAKNEKAVSQKMYVECGIIGAGNKTWIQASPQLKLMSTVQMLGPNENCMSNEPSTQTAQVEVDAGATKVVSFNLVAPKEGDYVLYCGNFERCSMGGTQDAYQTSGFYRDLKVLPSGVSNPQADAPKTQCTKDTDCSSILGTNICTNGACVKSTEVATDSSMMDWIKKNKIIVILGAITLLIIGSFFAFKEKPMYV